MNEHARVGWRGARRRGALVAVLVLAALVAGVLAFAVFPSRAGP